MGKSAWLTVSRVTTRAACSTSTASDGTTGTGSAGAEDLGETRASRAVLAILKAALTESLGDDKTCKADVKACERSGGVDGVLRIARVLVEDSP